MKKIYLFISIIFVGALFLYLFDLNSNKTYEDLEDIKIVEAVDKNQEAQTIANYKDLIRLTNIKEGQRIESPLRIEGEARGQWYFEGDFPVVLTNWDGLIIADGIASAKTNWMTEDYVPFSLELNFEKPELYDRGALILQKDNPSGLPENDDAYEIQILYK